MKRYVDVDELGIGRANPDAFENKDYVDGWDSAISILEKAGGKRRRDALLDRKYELRLHGRGSSRTALSQYTERRAPDENDKQERKHNGTQTLYRRRKRD